MEDVYPDCLHAIDALVTLVMAAELVGTAQGAAPSQRDHRFEGTNRCPSFAIVTKHSEVNIVIDNTLWRFDEEDQMSREMFEEVTQPLRAFLHTKLTEQTIHTIAACLRGQLERLVAEGRITKKLG